MGRGWVGGCMVMGGWVAVWVGWVAVGSWGARGGRASFAAAEDGDVTGGGGEGGDDGGGGGAAQPGAGGRVARGGAST